MVSGGLAKLRREVPKLRHMVADGGYAGPKLRDALVLLGRWTQQIVRRSDCAKGFEVISRRWVVERTAHGSDAADGWQGTGQRFRGDRGFV